MVGATKPHEAAPGTILAGYRTYALVRDQVRAERQEPLILKGAARPVEAWEILGLAGGVVREVAGQFHVKPKIGAACCKAQDAHRAIDVALDEMSAHAPGDGKGALEIDRAFAAESAQIGALDRFLEQVEGEVAAANGRSR